MQERFKSSRIGIINQINLKNQSENKARKGNLRACIAWSDPPPRIQHRLPHPDHQTLPSLITLRQRRIYKHTPADRERRETDMPDRRRELDGGEGCRSACYAQHADWQQEGNDGAADAVRSVKGSENGAYEGRIRRGRLPSDVRFTRPTTAMARPLADGTLLRWHLILRRSVSSRRRMQIPSWKLPGLV